MLGNDLYDWTKIAEDIKSPETSKKTYIEVKPEIAVEIYQIIAICGSFQVRTEKIIREVIDTF